VSARGGGDGVRVRMYRQGLGDCFLLTFRQGTETSHVLVDCGVVGGGDGTKRMRAVARDVSRATGGHLDLLVATHAHWDHVSGFVQAREVFDGMTIGEVWLSSAENPGSDAARAVRERRRELVSRLRDLSRSGLIRETSLGRGIAGVLGLFGECAAEGGDPGAAVPDVQEEEALDFLHDPSRIVRYLDAGEPPRPLPGCAGVRTYVLGPTAPAPAAGAPAPADAAARGALDLGGSFFTAARSALAMSDADREQWKDVLARNLPFDATDRVEWKAGDDGRPAFSLPSVGGAPPGECPRASAQFFRRYFAAAQAWRRIDYEWLGMARGLALTLESHTNDASLALAFELCGSRKVLLFPGDARVAPPAWDLLEWTVKGAEGEPEKVTPADLLRRTALYKVAHHCSQWATPASAVAAMQAGDLVAMLSVDAAAAAELQWSLPHPPLLEALLRRTRGRLLVSRGGEPVVAPEPPPYGAGPGEWKAFGDAVKETPLYVEYTLAG
jgi:hypothetical protein